MQSDHRTKFELLELDPFWDENGWRSVRVAIDGVPALPFQLHKTQMRNPSDEDEVIEYAFRGAINMIEKFGDARNPKNYYDDGRVN